MKSGPYFAVLLMGAACIVFVVSLILLAHTNQKLQVRLQSQQQVLSQGILGPQAQQISGGVLQDLAKSATGGNVEMRRLLEKYGYSVPASLPQKDPAASVPEKKAESTTTEDSNP